jgi:hypothetical protein
MNAAHLSPSPLWGEGRGEGPGLASRLLGASFPLGGLAQAFSSSLRPAPHPNPLPGGERGVEVIA